MIETLPDPLDNFGHDHFGNIVAPDPFVNLVNNPNADNLDLTVPPVGSNVPFSFNFGEGNFIGESEKTYDFDLPIYNSFIYNFDASSLQFNPSNFDFNSISTRDNRITFFFDFGAFDFSSITSQPGLKFDLINHFDRDNWNNVVNFGDELSFDATSVEFVSNAIVFEYEPGSFSFDRGSFIDNANLFDYKGISTNNYSINQFNASDFRALEYAFEGDELFDSEYYLSNNTIMPGMNPFTDYTERGNLLGSDPNSVFDNSYYNANNPDAATSRMTALEHYLDGGWRAGLPGDPNYDPEANVDFNPFFSSEDYFTIHDDVRVMSYDPEANSPLEDLINFGFVEGRITNEISLSDDVLKFSTLIYSNSESFESVKNDINNSNLGIQIASGDDGKILVSGFDASDNPIGRLFDYLKATLYAGGAFFLSKTGEILYEINKPSIFDNYSGTVVFGTPPFPDADEGRIVVEAFPGSEAITFDGNNIFTTPLEPVTDLNSPTVFPQRDKILANLLEGPFIFPDAIEIPQQFYTIDNGSANPFPIGSSSSQGIQEVEDFISGLRTPNVDRVTDSGLYQIEQTGLVEYVIPTGRTKPDGSLETIKADGFRGRTLVEVKFLRDPATSPRIAGTSAPDFLRIKALNDDRFEFLRYKALIENANIPFEGLEIILNDDRLVPYIEMLVNEVNIPNTQIKVKPSQAL